MDNDNNIEGQVGEVKAVISSLPGYSEWVKESFTKSLTSWPLFILLTGTVVVASGAEYLLGMGTFEGEGKMLTLVAVWFAATIVNLIFFVVAVKYYLNNQTGSIGEYFREVFGSAWSYLWIFILSMLVTVSGFILFIIPGILLTTYFIFALHARVAESATGINALVRSTELIRGYWWAVTLRLTVMALSIFTVIILASIVVTSLLIMTGVSEETIDRLSYVIFGPISGTLSTMIYFYAFTVLYRALVAIKAGEVPKPSSVRGWYIGLAILAPFLMVGIFVLASMFYVQFAQI